jgi:Bacteriophage holin family
MWEDYVALVDGFKLLTLAILVVADFILGVIVALKAGTFHFNKLAQFLNTTVLALVGGYFVVGFVALVEPSLKYVVVTCWGILSVALLGGITGKLGALGVPMPEVLSNPSAPIISSDVTTTTTTTTTSNQDK